MFFVLLCITYSFLTFLSFYITTDVQLHLTLKISKHDDDDHDDPLVENKLLVYTTFAVHVF